ncbi:hypothetical protein [Cohnella sp. GCM10027633]|uniref:hypothetical protein n=1 Tax=unclassified Cohnella TaxID=2636738 RepID=UPI00364201BA
MNRSDNANELAFHYSSVKLVHDDKLVAAPLGRGIELRDSSYQPWEPANDGLPELFHVNRLQSNGGHVFACTDKGLYRLEDREWETTGLFISTFQYRQYGTIALAGTSNGLWFSEGDDWRMMMRADAVVYDFLYLPQFVVLGTHEGLAILDRLTSSWMRYNYGAAVTSLAIHRDSIIGATEKGELLVSNSRGGFERYRMGNMFVFSIVSKGDAIYACTDRGLYRVVSVGGRPTLMAVKLGIQVTDVDTDGSRLYMATLFDGVQSMETV